MKGLLLLLAILLCGCMEVPTVNDPCTPPEEIITKPIDGSVISIIFEGGYKTDYIDAYPLMQSRGFRGTNYIVGSRIGFENYLNWPELSVMVNNGWDIGTTGYSGANMSLLSNCQIEEDLDRDIDEISHKLCYKVTSMVAPYDIVTDGLIEVAKSRGIRAILSAKCYPNSIVKEKIDGFDYPLLGNALKETKTSNKWLIVAIGRLKYCCNAEGFNQILGMISSSGIRVATVDEVLDGTRNL